MTFERIVDDGRLWAVRYDGKEINCFEELFGHWYDMQWLRDFFQNNISDLESFFFIFQMFMMLFWGQSTKRLDLNV